MERYFITSGAGTSAYQLVAFDNALLSARISNYNLVRVSSILPAGCAKRSFIDLPLASPLYTAFATVSSDIPGTRLATAIAVGIPKDSNMIGIIMEAKGETAESAAEMARNMVTEAMANHTIELDHIEFSAVEGVVEEGFLSLVSAISMW